MILKQLKEELLWISFGNALEIIELQASGLSSEIIHFLIFNAG